MASKDVNKAQKHIADIRQDFTASQRVKDTINNSIQILASDLYSKDTHFIFELIQNAEDNSYYENINPSLTFRLLTIDPTQTAGSEGALLIENNEKGFSAENVEAICQVGKSTKHKNQGYIGEKGIGFKSVFQITSIPYIFSRDYQFCLPKDDKETGLGYIVPQWVDAITHEVDPNKTTIILPLDNPKITYKNTENLLRDIQPETILFLSKLKEIQVRTDSNHEIIIRKDDCNLPLVQLLFKEVGKEDRIEEFLIHKKTFSKPEKINTEKRPNITEREIAIAFPLTAGSTSAGKIFAYLPVRSDTGLPFIVNADFLLTSSREDIMEDDPWNQWLRDCVAEVFVEAFEKWLEIPEYSKQLYGFIPLQANTEFLKPIVSSITNSLKDREIVLTEPDGKKCKPDKTKTAPENFRSLLTSGMYPKPLLETQDPRSARLVLNEIEKKYKEQLKAIGVGEITDLMIKQCFRDKEWIQKHDYDWLIDCYKYLVKHGSTITTVDLLNCPIIPIKVEGIFSWVCSNEKPIYFECNEDCVKILKELPNSVDIPIAFIDNEFYVKIKDHQEIINWLKIIVRIKELSKDKIGYQVWEWFCNNNNYNKLSEQDFVSVTYFVANHVLQQQITDIPILLSDSQRMLLSKAKLTEKHIVTPKALDPETGWQNLFQAGTDIIHLLILSDNYINLLSNNNDITDCIKTIKSLYKHLNITDKPPIYCYQRYYEKSEFQNYYCHTEYEKRFLSKIQWTRFIGIRNYRPFSWFDNLSSLTAEVKEKKSKSLVRYLSHISDNEIINFKNLRIHYFYRWEYDDPFESEFLNTLKNKPWLLTTKGFVCPHQAFKRSQVIDQFLGNSVPYLIDNLPEKVIELLEINTELTPTFLVDRLEQLSKKSVAEVDKNFVDKVYGYLYTCYTNNNLDITTILSRLQRLIFVSDVSGSKWLSSDSKVIWSDQSDILGKKYSYLEKIYPVHLGYFFTQLLGIKYNVTWHDLICLLKDFSKGTVVSDDIDDIDKVVTRIYEYLFSESKSYSWTMNLKPDFKSNNLIFVKDNKWLRSDENLMWSNQSDIIGEDSYYLEDIYPSSLKDFFVKTLEIKDKLDCNYLINQLERYKSQNSSYENIKSNLIKVYQYLYTERDTNEFQAILYNLKHKELICVSDGSICKWLSSTDKVIWSNQSNVFGDDYFYLENYYDLTLKDFFVHTIGVKESIETGDAESFTQRWLKIQYETGKDTKKIEYILTNIFEKIRSYCENNQSDSPTWWSEFLNKALVWTQNKTFEHPQSVYVADDGYLKQLFQDKGILFAWRPEKDSFSDWALFFKKLGVAFLSESVTISIANNVGITDSVEPKCLTDGAKIGISTWIKEKQPKDYQRIERDQTLDILLNTTEANINSLQVIYRLKDHEQIEPCSAFWDKDKKKLLLTDHNDKLEIARTLARGLMNESINNGLAEWIELVLGEDYEKIQRRLKKQDYREPDQVMAWFNSQERKQIPQPILNNKQPIYPYLQQDQHDVAVPSKHSHEASSIQALQNKPGIPIPTRAIKSEHKHRTSDDFDYRTELQNVFNKGGAEDLKGESGLANGIVSNPERRREIEAEEHQRRRMEEPDSVERRRKTERTIFEGPDEQVRESFRAWYGGRCQICANTFPQIDGRPFFIASYIVPRIFACFLDTPANALCLCAEHFAKWQHGAVEADDIAGQIEGLKLKAEGGDGDLRIKIKLCGEECTITFNEKHLIALQELLKLDL